jgi:hypothetical protein
MTEAFGSYHRRVLITHADFSFGIFVLRVRLEAFSADPDRTTSIYNVYISDSLIHVNSKAHFI